MKYLLEIKEHHDLETHLNLKRDFTGSLDKISVMAPSGSLGIWRGASMIPKPSALLSISRRFVVCKGWEFSVKNQFVSLLNHS